VLVVDDDKNIFHAIEIILEPLKLKLKYCPTIKCAEKLLIAGTAAIDILLLDLAVDIRSGLDLLDSLASSNIRIPVFMISGTDAALPAATAMQKGALYYFTKPLDSKELVARVEQVLALKPE